MLTLSSTTMLRVVPARTYSGLQPTLFRAAATACPYSTMPAAPLSLARPAKMLQSLAQSQSPTLSSLAPVAFRSPSALSLHHHLASRRAASTTTAATAQPAGAAASTSSTSQKSPPLDWNTFFKLRKRRRNWQLGFSIVTCLTSGAVGAFLLSDGYLDFATTQVPLDPFLTLGLITLAFLALGWLAGPTLGNAVFNVTNRQVRPQMSLKENQFFARIKKNRVDPSNASASNPVPDFYGEKISSVSGYRRWLKDQRAYEKKRTTFI